MKYSPTFTQILELPIYDILIYFTMIFLQCWSVLPLVPCSAAVLQCCSASALQCYSTAVLKCLTHPPCNAAVLQYCNTAVLQCWSVLLPAPCSAAVLQRCSQTYRKPVDLWIYPGADSLSGGQNVYIKARHIWFRGCFCHRTNLWVNAGAVEVALLPVSTCQASWNCFFFVFFFKIRSNRQ